MNSGPVGSGSPGHTREQPYTTGHRVVSAKRAKRAKRAKIWRPDSVQHPAFRPKPAVEPHAKGAKDTKAREWNETLSPSKGWLAFRIELKRPSLCGLCDLGVRRTAVFWFGLQGAKRGPVAQTLWRGLTARLFTRSGFLPGSPAPGIGRSQASRTQRTRRLTADPRVISLRSCRPGPGANAQRRWTAVGRSAKRSPRGASANREPPR